MLCRAYIIFGLLFTLQYSCSTRAASNGSTLMVGQELTSGEKLISSNGKFAFGFFQTGTSKSSSDTPLSNWYLGIWFHKLPKFTPVWVANGDKPIPELTFNLSKLIISKEGNLAILNHVTKSIIWSTQIVKRSKTSNDITAVLSNNGNLVVQEASNPTTVWWQSFEHPTNVFLPGAKIGRSKVTGKTYKFVSNKNLVDPAPGSYCMELDPSSSEQYFVKLCNSSVVYFSTGLWNGQYFPSVPEMSGSKFLNCKFIDNDQEEYFTYTPSDDTVITILLLDVSGVAKQLLWAGLN
ncbi:unnamed protein product [Urochloa humidicola]